MKRITLVLGVVAVMVALSAPAMAKDNGGNSGGGGAGHVSGSPGNSSGGGHNNGGNSVGGVGGGAGRASGSADDISGSSFSGGSIGGNLVGVGGAGGGTTNLNSSGAPGLTPVGGIGNVDFDDHDILVGFPRFDFDDVGDHIRSSDLVDLRTSLDNTPLNATSCTWVQVPTAWLDLYEWIVNPVEVSPGWWWGCGWRIF